MVVRGFGGSVECGCGGAHMGGCYKWVWQDGKACMNDLFFMVVFTCFLRIGCIEVIQGCVLCISELCLGVINECGGCRWWEGKTCINNL